MGVVVVAVLLVVIILMIIFAIRMYRKSDKTEQMSIGQQSPQSKQTDAAEMQMTRRVISSSSDAGPASGMLSYSSSPLSQVALSSQPQQVQQNPMVGMTTMTVSTNSTTIGTTASGNDQNFIAAVPIIHALHASNLSAASTIVAGLMVGDDVLDGEGEGENDIDDDPEIEAMYRPAKQIAVVNTPERPTITSTHNPPSPLQIGSMSTVVSLQINKTGTNDLFLEDEDDSTATTTSASTTSDESEDDDYNVTTEGIKYEYPVNTTPGK